MKVFPVWYISQHNDVLMQVHELYIVISAFAPTLQLVDKVSSDSAKSGSNVELLLYTVFIQCSKRLVQSQYVATKTHNSIELKDKLPTSSSTNYCSKTTVY